MYGCTDGDGSCVAYGSSKEIAGPDEEGIQKDEARREDLYLEN
jgi:hypothetical protein